MRRLFLNKVVTDMSSETEMMSGTSVSTCKISARRKQGSMKNRTATKTTNCYPFRKVLSASKQMKMWIFLLSCYSKKSIKVDWISYQVCKTWYHEFWVNAFKKRPYSLWKMCLSEILPHCDWDCTTCGTISINFLHV